MKELVLASKSPRRQAILAQMGFSDFTILETSSDETRRQGENPKAYVLRVAQEKAKFAAKTHPQATIIAADTIVVIGGKVLGKPADPAEAFAMLSKLSGRRHKVCTGLAVLSGGVMQAVAATAKVEFRRLSAAEIKAYIATGEPMDKAGAYGIQGRGAVLVRRIVGDFYTVMGLPVSLLWEILQKLGRKGGGTVVPTDL